MPTNKEFPVVRGIELKLKDQDAGEGGLGTVVGHYWKSQPQPPLSPSKKSNIPYAERGPPSAGQPGVVYENTDPHKAGFDDIDVDVEWCCGTNRENRAGFQVAHNLQVRSLEDSENGAEHSDVLPVPEVLSEDYFFTQPAAQFPSDEKADAAFPEVLNKPNAVFPDSFIQNYIISAHKIPAEPF